MVKRFFRRLSKYDWVTFISSGVLVLLALIPVFWDVSTADGWLRGALISLSALTLTTIALAQINARDSDKRFADQLVELKSLVQGAVSRDAVREIPAGQIRASLDEMLATSNEWYFRGGSARWQREAVLPRLALVKDRPVQYKIQIISPFEVELCDQYAAYRRKSRPGDAPADPKQIRLELMAFIFATVVWSARSKIVPSITLLHRFSPFRLDGNSKSFVITVADPDRPGLRTESGNWYHSSLLDEFEFEAGYATRLALPNEASDLHGADDVSAFFGNLQQLNPEAMENGIADYSKEDWRTVFELAGTSTV